MLTFLRSFRSPASIPVTEWGTVFRAPPPTGMVRGCDWVIEFLLGAFVLLSPAACGASESWGVEIVGGVVTVMAAALAVRCILTHRWPAIGRWPTIAILWFTALIVLQWAPLPKGVVGVLSPNSLALREALLKGLSAWDGARWTTLTFYPLMTQHLLGLVLCMATVYAATATVYQRREQVVRLLAAIAIAGVAVALFTLAQHIWGDQQVYWIYKPIQANSGPFPRYNQFSQFMNLSIAAMLGLLVLKPGGSGVGGEASGTGRVLMIGLWGAVGLTAAMLMLAVSRNGIISMIVAGAATIAVFTVRGTIKPRTTLLLLGGAGILVIVFSFGFDVVYQKLASTGQPEVSYGKRWVILLSLVESWRKFPIFGTGLGTLEYIFPMFDRQIRMEAHIVYADNDYAQMLTEMGALGLIPIGIFIFEIGRSYVRCVQRVTAPMTSVAVALGFGWIAILIHSFTDYGQHVPGIACLTAIYAGLIYRIGKPTAQAGFGSAKKAQRSVGWWMAWLAPAAIVGCGASYVVFEDHNRVGDSASRRATAIIDLDVGDGKELTDADYPGLVAGAGAAAAAQPANVKFLYLAAMTRWMAIRHAAGADVADVLPTPDVIEDAKKAVAAYRAARMACPTYKPNYLSAAQLETFLIVTPEGGNDYRKAVITGDRDPEALFEAARFDLREHDYAAAADKLQRLNDSDAPGIVQALLGGNASNAIFMQVAEGKTFMLQILANMPDEQGGNAGLRHDAAERLMALLEERCRRADAKAGDLAMFAGICVTGDHLPDALDAYQRALAKEPGNVGWRVELARVLEKVGYHAEALGEARRCLELDPHSGDAKQLLTELQSQ
jgi:tetratricopeptide (TPR) repeat protein